MTKTAKQSLYEKNATSLERSIYIFALASVIVTVVLVGPDSAFLGANSSLDLPYLDLKVIASSFLIFGPLVLTVLGTHMHLVFHKFRTDSYEKDNTLEFHIFNSRYLIPKLILYFSLYGILPIVLWIFFWKALPRPEGSYLFYYFIAISTMLLCIAVSRVRQNRKTTILERTLFWFFPIIVFIVIVMFHDPLLGYFRKERSLDLVKANLEESDLRDTDLSRAVMDGAKLRGANLQGAEMRKARLKYADLRESTMRGTNLQEAQLLGANLSQAWLDRIVLPNNERGQASLSKAILDNATLIGTRFYGTNLDYARFKDGVIKNSSFFNVDANGTNFRNVVANEAIFDRSKLTDVMFEGASLVAAKFRDTVVKGAQLQGTVLSGTNFLNSIVKESNFKRAIAIELQNPEGQLTFEGGQLISVNFDFSEFDGAIFRDIELEDISGEKATWSHIDFDCVQFKGTNIFSNSRLDEIRIGVDKGEICRADRGMLSVPSNSSVSRKSDSEVILDLSGSKLKNSRIENISLSTFRCNSCDLHEVTLRNISIEQADFQMAILEKVSFRDVHLGNVSFEGAKITSCDLSEADIPISAFKGAIIKDTKFSTSGEIDCSTLRTVAEACSP